MIYICHVHAMLIHLLFVFEYGGLSTCQHVHTKLIHLLIIAEYTVDDLLGNMFMLS